MIFPLLGMLIGGAFGFWRAFRRKGAVLDFLQWAAVGVIIGGCTGLFLLIIVDRIVS